MAALFTTFVPRCSSAKSPSVSLIKMITCSAVSGIAEQIALAMQIAEGNNFARDRLIKLYMRSVLKIALSMTKQYELDIEDAISSGCILSGTPHPPYISRFLFLLCPSGPREIDGSQTTTKLRKEIWWQNYCAGAVTLLHTILLPNTPREGGSSTCLKSHITTAIRCRTS